MSQSKLVFDFRVALPNNTNLDNTTLGRLARQLQLISPQQNSRACIDVVGRQPYEPMPVPEAHLAAISSRFNMTVLESYIRAELLVEDAYAVAHLALTLIQTLIRTGIRTGIPTPTLPDRTEALAASVALTRRAHLARRCL